ncbi:uncharacterized protein LOC129747454 isoform X2 [Uranotaenia lowii]|uniref:uncharacterized protein LOC129747454 isoform X2 n=1 Tax=Uranotaenia lowii TaxID=190385 RepID=UPI00247A131C|nr:uncharacterized protein LOC129747454 isoform X2 [Uranotaenia lowii]
MGNCFKGCLSEERNSARHGLSASDSQYEMLVEGSSTREQQRAKNKSKDKPKLLNRFWKRKDVEYSRLNKSNNNFVDRSKQRHHQISTGSEIQLQCLDAHSLLMVSKDSACRRNGYHDLNADMTSTPGSSLDLEWENDYGYQNNHWLPHLTEDLGQPLVAYPNPLDPVFKVEEWSTLKKSKDRINSIRRMDPRSLSSPLVPQSPDLMGGTPTGAHPMPPCHPNGGSGAAGFGTPSIRSCGSFASSSHISTPEDSLEWDVDQDRQLKSENESLDLETKELLLEIEQLKNRVLNETGANLKDLVQLDETIS